MVSQNLPFGEPLAPKRPTMRKIRPPENTLKNTPCKIAENVQNWLQNGVATFEGFHGFGSFFGVLLPRWLLEAPKAPKSRKKCKKHEENATLFSGFWASTVAWQAKFTATVAGAAGRLHGGVADQNKPMATVTAMLDLFWSAHPP